MERGSKNRLGTLNCCQPFLALMLIIWPWNMNTPWPSSSNDPIVPLAHETLSAHQGESARYLDGYSFVAYGDQRALADGEWQLLVQEIVRLDREETPLSLVIDSGDLVYNGRYTDQWGFLTELISPLVHLPYLVGVGNHEVNSNLPTGGRENTALYLQQLDKDFGVERMYYTVTLGKVQFIFLDSNDFVYGENGDREYPDAPVAGGRAEAQLVWLEELLSDADRSLRKIAIIHHPLIQSSKKHRRAAAALWGYSWQGRTLPDILADGGVDIILTGHTHSYERFEMTRSDDRRMTLINLSGRPRDSVLWFGKGKRRARDIRGEEREYFTDNGWPNLENWTIRQEEAMLEEQGNNFGLFTVDGDGDIWMELFLLADEFPDGVQREGPVKIQCD